MAAGTDLEALVRLLDGARSTMVLTGAGISTDSGIPDYRGPDGNRRVTPMLYSEFRRSTAARRRYWARAFVGWRRFAAVEPNAGHRAVARLQRAGVLGPLVTQNVDGLHQAAGSEAAIELHGSLATVVCVGCGYRTARHELDAALRSLNPDFRPEERELLPDGDVNLPDCDVEAFVLPRCARCEDDLLKPDVVFFGESVPKPRVARCMALVDDADALLVLGSSLRVFSGYRFVRRAAERGIPVAIVTRGPTRADPEAEVRLDADLGEVLPALAARIAA